MVSHSHDQCCLQPNQTGKRKTTRVVGFLGIGTQHNVLSSEWEVQLSFLRGDEFGPVVSGFYRAWLRVYRSKTSFATLIMWILRSFLLNFVRSASRVSELNRNRFSIVEERRQSDFLPHESVVFEKFVAESDRSTLVRSQQTSKKDVSDSNFKFWNSTFSFFWKNPEFWKMANRYWWNWVG